MQEQVGAAGRQRNARGVMSWIGTLEPGYMIAPFASVLEVTLQAGIARLL